MREGKEEMKIGMVCFTGQRWNFTHFIFQIDFFIIFYCPASACYFTITDKTDDDVEFIRFTLLINTIQNMRHGRLAWSDAGALWLLQTLAACQTPPTSTAYRRSLSVRSRSTFVFSTRTSRHVSANCYYDYLHCARSQHKSSNNCSLCDLSAKRQ